MSWNDGSLNPSSSLCAVLQDGFIARFGLASRFTSLGTNRGRRGAILAQAPLLWLLEGLFSFGGVPQERGGHPKKWSQHLQLSQTNPPTRGRRQRNRESERHRAVFCASREVWERRSSRLRQFGFLLSFFRRGIRGDGSSTCLLRGTSRMTP